MRLKLYPCSDLISILFPDFIRSLPLPYCFPFSDGDVNHVVLIFAMICMFLFTVSFGTYITIVHDVGRDSNDLIAHWKTQLQWFPMRLEETSLFLSVSICSLFLISRVLKGQCPPDTSLWEQQTCNQFATQGGIPTELAYALYMAPMVFPFSNDLSIRTLVISHLTTLAVVTFCVIYSNAWSDYYVLLNWLIFSNISFEFVRIQRIAFKEYINAKFLLEEAVTRSKEIQNLKQDQERSR